MTESIVFYQLGAKFLERKEDIPEKSKEVVYYSLAIGHHVGVFDCFKPKLRCSADLFDRVLAALPEGGEARRKLGGILRFGEIQVDRSHTGMLQAAINEALPSADPEVAGWFNDFGSSLEAIRQEPAIYLMGRRLP